MTPFALPDEIDVLAAGNLGHLAVRFALGLLLQRAIS